MHLQIHNVAEVASKMIASFLKRHKGALSTRGNLPLLLPLLLKLPCRTGSAELCSEPSSPSS
jgi:hypothetical protein